MPLPEILAEDLMIVPDEGIDIKIWSETSVNAIFESQPLFFKYMSQIAKVHGEKACCAVLVAFKVIEHAVERSENGFY
jgi:hypothetical protein